MLFERPQSGERAVLVHVEFKSLSYQSDCNDLLEFKELARASGAIVTGQLSAVRDKPNPKYYIGQGKLAELKQYVIENKAELVLFNHELSAAQERNLEKYLHARVLSRTGLILDIFAQRARTFEGKLQVELAQLQHMATRLVRGWTHLERQKGGIGLRGPGEKQLESDRRLLRERINYIEKRLKKVRLSRKQIRKQRNKSQIPTVALVGYTNAGKSTLFNALTGAKALVADQLFATLDPLVRNIKLPTIGMVALVDTVGFVKNLPHKLVEAFRATLEETRQADLLLHVVDFHAENYQENILAVNEVLHEIEADVPQLMVYNKVDLLPNSERKIGDTENFDKHSKALPKVWLSALDKLGIEVLGDCIIKCLSKDLILGTIILPSEQARLHARLHANLAILEESITKDGEWRLKIRMPEAKWINLCNEFEVLKTLKLTHQ